MRFSKTILLLLLFLSSLLFGCASGLKAPTQIRVLTYNIRHGRGMDDRIDLNRIAEVIKRCDPHIVALQEVDQATERSGGVDQAAVLGELTGMTHWFGRAIYHAGGEYGEAVLSRLPVTSVVRHPLPCSPGHEERCALAVRVKTAEGGKEFLFVATHLDHTRDHRDRIAQVEEILERLPMDEPLPMLLAGDLNAESHEEPMQLLLERFEDASASAPAPTIPSTDPKKRIDFILFKPEDRWRVVETRVVDEREASDHCPLLVVLELLP